MQSLKLQPTFRVPLPLAAEPAVQRLRAAIESSELKGLVASAGRCVDFQVERADQRFWSPHLSVQVEDTAEGSLLFARFSPRPEIWTFVMAIYFAASFVICSAAIYGYVLWFLGESPWVLLLIPISLLMIFLLHLASLIGQGLSSDQMQLLRARLDRLLELSFPDRIASVNAGR